MTLKQRQMIIRRQERTKLQDSMLDKSEFWEMLTLIVDTDRSQGAAPVSLICPPHKWHLKSYFKLPKLESLESLRGLKIGQMPTVKLFYNNSWEHATHSARDCSSSVITKYIIEKAVAQMYDDEWWQGIKFLLIKEKLYQGLPRTKSFHIIVSLYELFSFYKGVSSVAWKSMIMLHFTLS